MIRLNCSNCGQKIKTDEKYAGKRVRCPACKQPVQIPQVKGGTGPAKPAIIKFRCPNCSQKIGVSPDYAGKVVRCAKCKHRLRVPQPPGVTPQPKPKDDLAPLRVAPEQPAADEGGMPGLGDMSDLLQLEAGAPAVEEQLQLTPIEEPAADSRVQDYASQFPTGTSYQDGGGGEKKKTKLVVPIVIGAVFIVAFVIGYMAVSSFMNKLTSSLETIDESQEGANLDEAQQFTEDYIALLADGNIEAAIERLSPDVKATTANDQIETLAKQIGTSEILEMKLGPTNYEQDLAAEHYYLLYTLDYDRDIATFIASVRQVDDEFTIDGIATGGSLGPSVVIGPLTKQELSQKAMMGQVSEEDIGAIGDFFAKSFCGIMVVFLIIALIQIISMGIVFDKAGQPGWAVIVPFYNMWVLAEVGDKPGWMGLVMCFCSFIPVIGIILYWVLLITISIGVAKTFERGVGFGIGLSFLPFIFFPILAFSRD